MVSRTNSVAGTSAVTPEAKFQPSSRTRQLNEAMQLIKTSAVKESPAKFYQENNEFEQSVRQAMVGAEPGVANILNTVVQYNYDGAIAVLKEAASVSARMDAGQNVKTADLSVGSKLLLTTAMAAELAPTNGWKPH